MDVWDLMDPTAGFLACMTGPTGGPLPDPACSIQDADGDKDVDLQDFIGPGGFLDNLTGPSGGAGCP